MENFFDRLHASARRLPALHRLAILTRLLLALAFIPTGMVKLLGKRFTLISVEHPVGAFFEAMYQTGFYWNFLGVGQVSAGILLLIPHTTTLGAIAFFPIILNITVVTWSIRFPGTMYITALMLLAGVFLLCWDYDRLKHILFAPHERPTIAGPIDMPLVERLGYVVGTASGLVILLATRSLVPTSITKWMLLTGGLAALMVLAGWMQTIWRSRLAAQIE